MLLNDGLVPVPGTRQLGNGGRAKRHKRAEECQYLPSVPSCGDPGMIY